MHDFFAGGLRGFGAGGNLRARFGQRGYYYTDAATRERRLLEFEDSLNFTLVLSYQRALGHSRRLTWKTQLNVENVFDTMNLRILPRVANGVALDAKHDALPRRFVWTNSVRF